ncbi:probable phosphoglycerate mutase [Kandleria vitulina]|uniref:histidine phosphatase family protein n=1 Tax=Kandleria vitulina TaxID=1630 RepID=UPI00088F3A10|nr:histidine phosphatase family protein [Kandleria vitulina]SDM00883.1 probable phosphoglycerate mutase [Kandleria vitulina]
MKDLYLMRHGETLFNIRRKIQGWCDSPLTENGINQALMAKQKIKGINFDHYYSSTAERCCDTLELVAGDVNYKRLKGLKERNFGTFEGESEDLNPVWGNPDFTYDDLFPHYGGELRADVSRRMKKTLTDIMNKDDHHCVLAVSHAGACAAFYSTVADYTTFRKEHGRLMNCDILHFQFENDTFTFVELLRI